MAKQQFDQGEHHDADRETGGDRIDRNVGDQDHVGNREQQVDDAGDPEPLPGGQLSFRCAFYPVKLAKLLLGGASPLIAEVGVYQIGQCIGHKPIHHQSPFLQATLVPVEERSYRTPTPRRLIMLEYSIQPLLRIIASHA